WRRADDGEGSAGEPPSPDRRRLVAGLLFASGLPALARAQRTAAGGSSFGFDDVDAMARTLATRPWKSPAERLPAELRDLDYDALRDIRFKPEQALWHGDRLPFEIQFLHMGRGVRDPVTINVIEPGGVHEVPFDPAQYDYGRNRLDPTRLRSL